MNAKPPDTPSHQFSLRMLLLLTLVLSVAAAAWGGLMRPDADRPWIVFVAAAAPLGLLIVVGTVHQLIRRRR